MCYLKERSTAEVLTAFVKQIYIFQIARENMMCVLHKNKACERFN